MKKYHFVRQLCMLFLFCVRACMHALCKIAHSSNGVKLHRLQIKKKGSTNDDDDDGARKCKGKAIEIVYIKWFEF